MDYCQDVIYSEDYEDFIIEYTGQEETFQQNIWGECIQRVDPQFGVIYQRTANVQEEWRNTILMMPRLFGLLDSDEMLEESGVMPVRRLPGLDLYGRGVLFGIVDTGDAVR